MKLGSLTQLEAVPGGLDAACGKAGPTGGRSERWQLRPWAPPCFCNEEAGVPGRRGAEQLQKNGYFDNSEKVAIIDRDHFALSISDQCSLLSFPSPPSTSSRHQYLKRISSS
jgi:hypothetical protein